MSWSPSAIALLVLALAGEAKHPSTVNAATASNRTRCYEAEANWAVADAPYPAWARAVFPRYPNARPTQCIAGTYEFWTGDDPGTVLAWFKAHTAATWARAGTVPNCWNGWRNSVTIFIAPPPTAAKGVKTVIQVTALER